MVHHADGDLLREPAGIRPEQVDLGEVVLGRLHGPHVALQALEVDLDRVRVRLARVDLLHVRVAPAGVDPQLDVIEPVHLVVERVDEEVEQLRLVRVEAGDEVDRRLLDLDHLRPGGRELAQLGVHRGRHVPDELLLVVEVVLGRVAVEEDREHLRRAGPELDGLARGRARLGDPPQLGVLERVARVVLDLADHARPAPRRLDLVHQRPGRELQQPVTRTLVLQLLVLEPRPALQRVVVPRAAGEVLVQVVVAVGEDVEARALLVGDHGGVRVEELLAEADVEQRRVEGPAPQAAVVPARPRPRSGDGRREHQVLGGGEHRARLLVEIGWSVDPRWSRRAGNSPGGLAAPRWPQLDAPPTRRAPTIRG